MHRCVHAGLLLAEVGRFWIYIKSGWRSSAILSANHTHLRHAQMLGSTGAERRVTPIKPSLVLAALLLLLPLGVSGQNNYCAG